MKKRKRKTNRFIIICIIAVLVLISLALFFYFKKDEISGIGLEISGTEEISPVELAKNREKYEGQTVKVVNALISDPIFIYVKEVNEKIFIKPTKPTYCLYFNVTGKLQRDDSFKEWIFLVNQFDCNSKT